MRLLASFLTLASCCALHAAPVSLFDGKTLEGWDYDPKMWRVEDGMITGGSRTEKITHNDFIATKKSYQNFELILKIKVTGDPATGMLNSGIQIRSVRVPGGTHMSGYQIDCGKDWFGKIYDEFRRNKVIAEPVDPAALEKVVDVYGWNEYRIRAEGTRIQTWINGVLAIDYTEKDKNIAQDGQIGPQVHSGGVCLVQIKDVTIEELPSTPGLPTWESLGGPEAARKLVAPPPKKADASKTKSGRDVSYNAVQGTARSAEEQQKLFKLPEGYEIELVVKESEGLGKFISVYFDQRGRLWTQTALEYPVDSNENPAAAEALYAGKGKDKVVVYPREALNAPLPPGGLTNPAVFADGLAIPLGILPWGPGDSCYVQHGHDIALLTDTDKDGKADKREVVLTGFGIQDSHLFPHQFTRAPGGWIWMAQGLFNKSVVKKPGEDSTTSFDMCRMARFRPDGSNFEATSVGPNNVWGLVITGEGEAFIQEANDYGYPVMPFHEYAYYPGGTEGIKKSYQPDFPPTADFRMGGTGLSGLALGEGGFRAMTPTVKEDGLCMFVANPITSKIQTIAMHRDGPYWKLEQAPDLITCEDPLFRPVAMTNGPDGCIYIVDWYNKIISHNEVPRNHPDRDKTRGRIWRVKAKEAKGARTLLSASKPNAAPPPNSKETPYHPAIPDFTQLSDDELIDLLGSEPMAKAHLAWQTLADRDGAKLIHSVESIVLDQSASSLQRIQALWVMDEYEAVDPDLELPLLEDANPNLRSAMTAALGNKFLRHNSKEDYTGGDDLLNERIAMQKDEKDPRVRIRIICAIAAALECGPRDRSMAIPFLLSFVKPSLPGPTTQATRGNKQIPVREAYDREFERFLVRMFLERHPDRVAVFLDSEAAAKLPLEARLLASLALEPKASASRVAKLLPQLDRVPNDEELLRLAQFPQEPGVGGALQKLLSSPSSRTAVAEKLLANSTKLDPAKVAPLLTSSARSLLSGGEQEQEFGLSLAASFQLAALESEILSLARATPPSVHALQALRQLRSGDSSLFAEVAKTASDPETRRAAVGALAASRSPEAGTKIVALYSGLDSTVRREALAALSGNADGANAIVSAVLAKTIPVSDLDATVIERLAVVLANDPALAQLQQHLGGVFHDVLALDGSDDAWCDSNIILDGPFTLETWVRLTGNIHNNDSILGSPAKLDMNFYQGSFRVWLGPEIRDVVVSKKPITTDLWTHIAVTRDAKGNFTLYQNGELDSVGTKPTNQKFENCDIALSGPKTGTEGAFAEYRLWNHARTPAEIRANFDRSLESRDGMKRFDGNWGKLNKGARIAKTIDAPPLLTEEQATALDTKFQKYSTLAAKGHPEAGKPFAALCLACHQVQGQGGQLGPNLSGAGAMGLEAVLRNILTPNAAMEPGYRTFRVELANGDLIDAFFVSEDKEAIIVRQAGVPDRRLARKDIRRTQYIRRSLMPEGLLDALPDQAAADLLAYLMTLR